MNKTCFKFIFSCFALVVFIIGALSCASAESTTSNETSGNASRDGAQTETQHLDGIKKNAGIKFN